MEEKETAEGETHPHLIILIVEMTTEIDQQDMLQNIQVEHMILLHTLIEPHKLQRLHRPIRIIGQIHTLPATNLNIRTHLLSQRHSALLIFKL